MTKQDTIQHFKSHIKTWLPRTKPTLPSNRQAPYDIEFTHNNLKKRVVLVPVSEAFLNKGEAVVTLQTVRFDTAGYTRPMRRTGNDVDFAKRAGGHLRGFNYVAFVSPRTTVLVPAEVLHDYYDTHARLRWHDKFINTNFTCLVGELMLVSPDVVVLGEAVNIATEIPEEVYAPGSVFSSAAGVATVITSDDSFLPVSDETPVHRSITFTDQGITLHQ